LSWTVIVPDDIEAEIDAISNDELREEILSKLDDLEEDPYSHLQKMRHYPYYKFRVNGYRGIVIMQNRKLVVLLLRLKQRNIAYIDMKDLARR